MIKHDFHLHSSFSFDSDAPAENMIKRSIELGLHSICFTEHMDYDNPDHTFSFHHDIDTYFKTIYGLKEKYSSNIKILCGVELGLQKDINNKYKSLLHSHHQFDFIIGSSHMAKGEDPYYPPYFEKRTDYEGFKDYFEEILENVCDFKDYQVYGHLDYVIRYSPNKNSNYKCSDYMYLIDEILKKLISLSKGIELNTAGLKYQLGHPHPHPDIIKRYKELGGEIITVGSDAHSPEHIAYDFKLASDLLKECGFDYYATFENQKVQMHKIT